MFLFCVQFPFADMRKFIQGTGQLGVPGWPFPTPDTEFVRGFGSIRNRRGGGVSGWVGENEICSARRVMTFCQNLRLTFPGENGPSLPLRCAFRHLYFDGWAVGMYEVGFAPVGELDVELSRDDFKYLVEYFLNLPVLIHQQRKQMVRQAPLYQAGKYIAQAYLSATTRHGAQSQTQDWWVAAGKPVLLLENHNDHFLSPYFSRQIDLPASEDFSLSHSLIPFRGQEMRLWWINKPYDWQGGTAYNRARALRITLLRLNAEHEALRVLLRNLMNKRIAIQPRTPQSDDLQAYLNEAVSRISKLERASDEQYDTQITEIARETLDTISPGQRETLLTTLESMDIRKNIFRKTLKYVDQIVYIEEQHMGDEYHISGQAGAVGPNAKAENNVFNQFGANADPAQLQALAKELATLRLELKKEAAEPEQDVDVGEVAQAQVEAAKGNGQKALEHLQKVGSWVLDVATKIGVTIATQAIKDALGMK